MTYELLAVLAFAGGGMLAAGAFTATRAVMDWLERYAEERRVRDLGRVSDDWRPWPRRRA